MYRRDGSGAWQADPDVYTGKNSFPLPALSRPIPVAEFYGTVLDLEGRALLR